VQQALGGGLHRVEAEVDIKQVPLRRTLQRAGLRPEGVARGRLTGPDGIPRDVTRLARLRDDAPLGTREAFLAMLNATLPLKRVIGQGLIGDGAGRFLMCELLYKQEWDLPGGVVDPRESPAHAVVREVREELGATVEAGGLLAVDWLPPYRQWEDALLCVFDLGDHPALVDRAVLETSEIKAVHWCDLETAREHAAPYVVRLLEQIGAGERTAYLEDGKPAALDR
jgi:8-oxo-dGTP pyrophosphatase MutT (NUDIX family)